MAVFTAAAGWLVSTAISSTFAATVGGKILTSVVAAGLGAATNSIINGGRGAGANTGAGSQPTTPAGNRLQLPPGMDNRIPVVYGTVYKGGNIVDAQISNENKTMTYVIALSEKTQTGTFSIDKVYWNDKELTINSSGVVQSATDRDGNVDTDLADKVRVYAWAGSSGSADAILGGSNNAYSIVPGWDSNDNMTDLVFAVVQIDYDAEKGITGIPNLTFKMTNTLNNPGNVLYDYMTSTRYGAGIAASEIDATSITTTLTNYSNTSVSYNDYQSGTQTRNLYEINGLIDTGATVQENMDQILFSCNSWLVYDFIQGKWKVNINKAETTTNAFVFNDDNIVSEINLTTTPLSGLYNKAEARFYNTDNEDQKDFVSIEISAALRNDLEPDNTLTLDYKLVNSNIQAEILATQELKQIRDDLVVSFVADYSALQLQAGEVVKITNSVFGWTDKLYRIIRVKEITNNDGGIFTEITAIEYNADVYNIAQNITQYTPASNSDIPLYTRLTTPNAPKLSGYSYNSDSPFFTMSMTIPGNNPPSEVEWYVSEDNTNFTRYSSKRKNYSANSTETMDFRGFDTGVYYVKVRTIRQGGYVSDYSDSKVVVWQPDSYINTSKGLALTFGVDTPVLETFPNAITIQQTSGGANDFTNYEYYLYIQVRIGLEKVNLSTATTDNLMANNSWRVADITADNITLGSPTNDTTDEYVKYEITGLTASTGIVRPTVRYKDGSGDVFSLPAYNIIVNSRPYNYDAPDGKLVKLLATNKAFRTSGQTTTPSNIYLELANSGIDDTLSGVVWKAYNDSGSNITSSLTGSGISRTMPSSMITGNQYVDILVYGDVDDETYTDSVRIYHMDSDTYNDNSFYTGTIQLSDEMILVPYASTGGDLENEEWQLPPQAYRSFARLVDYSSGDITNNGAFDIQYQTNTAVDYYRDGLTLNKEDLFGEIKATEYFNLTKDIGWAQVSGTSQNASGTKGIFYIKSRNGVGTTQGANPANIEEVVINTAYPAFWTTSISSPTSASGPREVMLLAQMMNQNVLTTLSATYTWTYKSETDTQYSSTYRTGPVLLLDRDEYDTLLNQNDDYIDFKIVVDDENQPQTYESVYRVFKYNPSSGYLLNIDNQYLNIPADSSGTIQSGHDWTLISRPVSFWNGTGTMNLNNGSGTQGTFSIVSQTGISGASIDNFTGTITFSSSTTMSAATATVVIRFTSGQDTYDATLTVRKQTQS